MQLLNLLVLLPAIATAIPSSPPIEARADVVAQDNCNNHIGGCLDHDCNGHYKSSWDTIGTCTTGNFKGCQCSKCNGKTGHCDKHGCNGVRGICQSGEFKGCSC
ncbi:hypothetical protein BCR34DRAFT_579500, partial [Clohesyomyces aquaticus]